MIPTTKNIRLFFNQNCILCHQRLRRSNRSFLSTLCTGCMRDLPWAEAACLQCGLPLQPTSHSMRCEFCLDISPPFTNTLCALWYDFPINRILPNVKHLGGQAHLHWLTHALLLKIEQSISERPEALIPVPMHPLKQLKRGFNQADFIAAELGKQLGVPVLYNHLKKVKRTQVQASLKRDQRLNNLKTAFQVKEDHNNTLPKHVAIVDDVMTTGATMTAIALCLKAHGVKQVDVWTLARTPRP